MIGTDLGSVQFCECCGNLKDFLIDYEEKVWGMVDAVWDTQHSCWDAQWNDPKVGKSEYVFCSAGIVECCECGSQKVIQYNLKLDSDRIALGMRLLFRTAMPGVEG